MSHFEREKERLIVGGYLYQFLRKEKQLELGKEIYTFDALFEINNLQIIP